MTYTHSITSKGQITLPKELRDHVGLKPGQSARVSLLDDRSIVIKAPLPVEEIRRLVGPPSGSDPLTYKEKLRLQARGLLK